MKTALRHLFRPLLDRLESGEEAFSYKPSHRTILLGVGGLFLFLSCLSIFLSLSMSEIGGVISSIVFFLISLVCVVVGLVGNDRAVAKLWGSR